MNIGETAVPGSLLKHPGTEADEVKIYFPNPSMMGYSLLSDGPKVLTESGSS